MKKSKKIFILLCLIVTMCLNVTTIFASNTLHTYSITYYFYGVKQYITVVTYYEHIGFVKRDDRAYLMYYYKGVYGDLNSHEEETISITNNTRKEDYIVLCPSLDCITEEFDGVQLYENVDEFVQAFQEENSEKEPSSGEILDIPTTNDNIDISEKLKEYISNDFVYCVGLGFVLGFAITLIIALSFYTFSNLLKIVKKC